VKKLQDFKGENGNLLMEHIEKIDNLLKQRNGVIFAYFRRIRI